MMRFVFAFALLFYCASASAQRNRGETTSVPRGAFAFGIWESEWSQARFKAAQCNTDRLCVTVIQGYKKNCGPSRVGDQVVTDAVYEDVTKTWKGKIKVHCDMKSTLLNEPTLWDFEMRAGQRDTIELSYQAIHIVWKRVPEK
jgi:hypothetical protein